MGQTTKTRLEFAMAERPKIDSRVACDRYPPDASGNLGGGKLQRKIAGCRA